MKHFFPGPHTENARQAMRSLGYGEHVGFGGQLSYARRMTANLFPRFHAYVEDKNGGIQVNLHLDQKEASYSGSSAHGGEYDGELVETEMSRIVDYLSPITPFTTEHKKSEPPADIQRPAPAPIISKKKSSLWD